MKQDSDSSARDQIIAETSRSAEESGDYESTSSDSERHDEDEIQARLE